MWPVATALDGWHKHFFHRRNFYWPVLTYTGRKWTWCKVSKWQVVAKLTCVCIVLSTEGWQRGSDSQRAFHGPRHRVNPGSSETSRSLSQPSLLPVGYKCITIVRTLNTEFILVWLCINSCIIFCGNSRKPTFAPPCTCSQDPLPKVKSMHSVQCSLFSCSSMFLGKAPWGCGFGARQIQD